MQLRQHTFRDIGNGAACAALILLSHASAKLVAGDIGAIHDKLRQDESYQFAFAAPPETNATPDWLRPLFELIAALFNFIGPILNILFWVGVALIAIAAIFFIGREIWRQRKGRDETDTPEAPPVYQPSSSLTRALLEEADRLASEGKYSEAVRVLLFRSIEDIERSHPNHVRIAMTSREIAKLEILRNTAREAFSQIAAAVETSHFAGHVINANVFAECRSAYHVFAELEHAS